MNLIKYFNPQPTIKDLPRTIGNPFNNKPHKIAIDAAKLLKEQLEHDFSKSEFFYKDNNGKMFGVLVVTDSVGNVGYLSAFSGMLFKRWDVNGFVPPVFNVTKMKQLLDRGDQQLATLTLNIDYLEKNTKRKQLLNTLDIYEKDSLLALAKMKQSHKDNKQKRKKLRQLAYGLDNADSKLFNLSQQSQDDKRAYNTLKKRFGKMIDNIQIQLNDLFDKEIEQLKNKRKQLSQKLHKQVFDQYQLHDFTGESKSIVALFKDKLPPGGTADCAAPKLVHYAFLNNLKILALSEFWWGASPKKEIRHHNYFYPPCHSRCHHILPFMLNGLNLENSDKANQQNLVPEIIYEDDFIIVLNKPKGMLSIPGKVQKYSVFTWIKSKYPKATGALVLHRLDQATSGIMLAAKTSEVYKKIQQQFIKRSVKKRYVALLQKPLMSKKIDIDLPLRVDLNDRPRQLVCFEHGKHAQTRVELINIENGFSRVYFYPKTGRTHQLRVHAAHYLGLDNPIVGDALYGSKSSRLMLHAEKIEFYHPIKKETCIFQLKAPF